MPTSPAPTAEVSLHAAIEGVRLAGQMCKRLQHSLAHEGVSKADGSPVTVADYAAQALIVRTLIEHEADAPIAGEEQAHTLGQAPALLAQVALALQSASAWTDATPEQVLAMLGHRACTTDLLPERAWVIDPVDGTKGFLAQRHFAVCLALIERGRPVVAALACPNLAFDISHEPSTAADEHAVRIDPIGMVIACTANGPVLHGPLLTHAGEICQAPLRPIPPRPGLPRAHPIITFSVEASEGRVRNFTSLADEMAHTLGSRPVPLAMDSQAKYALVARGQADVYDRPPRRNSEKAWDHAAGCLLLERAGCLVTDALGQPLDWSRITLGQTQGILGAPADLHAAVLAARKAVGGRQ